MENDDFTPGSVWLVGAGPGDPELLTRKAARLIAQADVILHDALVDDRALTLAAPQARLVDVGKRAGRHSSDQPVIDELIVRAALDGHRVVRLKGGDPSIFGRLAEELAACRSAGVPVKVCPGITAACAAAASGQVPLTLRGLSRRLTVVTARARVGERFDMDWNSLATPDATLAIYMGRAAAGDVVAGLLGAGLPASTPVMVVANASLPSERLIRGRLDALSFLVATIGRRDPVLLLVGEALEEASTAAPRQPARARGRLRETT